MLDQNFVEESVDLELKSATTLTRDYEFVDNDNNPLDLSSAKLVFTCKKEPYDMSPEDVGDNLIIKKNLVIRGNTATLTLTPEETFLEPDKYFYDIKLQIPGEEDSVVVYGLFKIHKTNSTNRGRW